MKPPISKEIISLLKFHINFFFLIKKESYQNTLLENSKTKIYLTCLNSLTERKNFILRFSFIPISRNMDLFQIYTAIGKRLLFEFSFSLFLCVPEKLYTISILFIWSITFFFKAFRKITE